MPRASREVRLIPAWAGKTPASTQHYNLTRAHPRVGGENTRIIVKQLASEGSSPRGRGKRTPESRRLCTLGLIPAWAGKTRIPSSVGTHVSAHPRVGGENRPSMSTVLVVSGSSPRGRGKLAAQMREGLAARLIPAWAGKTRDTGPAYGDRPAHPRVGGENRQ